MNIAQQNDNKKYNETYHLRRRAILIPNFHNYNYKGMHYDNQQRELTLWGLKDADTHYAGLPRFENSLSLVWFGLDC